MTFRNYSTTARPRAAAQRSLTALQVADAYHFPRKQYTGRGLRAGVIELGGGFGQADLDSYFGGLGLATPSVTAKPVAGGSNTPDGPNGADGEVLLDIEVLGSVAPGAAQTVYFGPNTDAGFLAAIDAAIADNVDVVTISWGQAESQWSRTSLTSFDAAFAAARAAGIPVFVAAGDSGANDSTSAPVTDFPASSPHVIGCGGTNLILASDGSRAEESTWNENPHTSATGGGVSKAFPGRQVPDIAGDADPYTGYEVVIDGGQYVIGGTSAVAPLMAGLYLLLLEAYGARFDFANLAVTNPTAFYDVTVGDNRTGRGRDTATGLGVPDGALLLAALTSGIPAPVPPTPVQPTPPAPKPASVTRTWADPIHVAQLDKWAAARHTGSNKTAATDWKAGTPA